ncbi:MAG: A24 family peptidase [Candidatus Zixiibacteriota bacterium]
MAQYAHQAVIPVVIALIAIAAYTDWRWRIIKNVFTLPAIAMGLLLQGLSNGWPGLIAGLLGLGVGAGLMMIPYFFGQMGAGDVKLMAALGALLGAFAALNVFLYTTLAGGILAMGIALYHKEGFNTLRRTWHLAKGLFIFRTLPASEPEPKKGITMPYGVAIAVGTITYLLWGNVV